MDKIVFNSSIRRSTLDRDSTMMKKHKRCVAERERERERERESGAIVICRNACIGVTNELNV